MKGNRRATQNSAKGNRTLGWFLAGVLALWFVTVSSFAFAGFFERATEEFPAAVLIGFLGPIVLFLVAYWSSKSLRRFVLTMDLSVATAVQGGRFGGLAFLGFYAHGMLPGFFAWPAGLGDMAIGITAPWIAMRLERHPEFVASKTYIGWNVFGLLDFVVAIGTGILCSGIAMGTFGTTTTEIMSQVPLVFVPVFFVPLYSILHLVGLLRAWAA